MQDQKTATLATIFSEVLANLAFMFTDEDLADPPACDEWLETTIAYSGPVTGALKLRCSRDFSTRLAANLLGLDPDDPDTEQSASDAVKEFMNIVCGQFITAAYGTEEVFNLTIPKIVELPDTSDLTPCEGAIAPPQGVDAPLQGVETSVVSIDGQLVQLTHLPDGTPSAA